MALDINGVKITGIAVDSRKVSAGDLFVCIRGMTVDGHDFIDEAVNSGASAVLCETMPANIKGGVKYIGTDDARGALARILKDFYPKVKDINLVGVTGTKGKTSTTYYISAVLNHAGRKTGVIGTTGAFTPDKTIHIPYQTSSTPDILDLYRILDRMGDSGCTHVAMEATSHGLHQRRMEGLRFKAAVFTNLTHDHLDYHKTMENYVNAKAMLFRQCDIAVINKDAEYINEILAGVDGILIKYYGIGNGGSIGDSNDGYFAEDVSLLPDGVSFSVRGQKFTLGIPGKFSIYNALSAIAVACETGVPLDAAAEGLSKIKGVPGRFEKVPNNRGITVIVDYAHTADSLDNIISSVREFTEGRVITVFGCGGERDRAKRPEMGKVAGRLSDLSVITSDNPRGEEPMSIIEEILPGLVETKAEYLVEADRRKAIEIAITTAKQGDSVIIAGKGHEPYMEFENRRRVPFSDMEEAIKAVNG